MNVFQLVVTQLCSEGGGVHSSAKEVAFILRLIRTGTSQLEEVVHQWRIPHRRRREEERQVQAAEGDCDE